MLSRHGWMLAASGVAVAVAGRVVGMYELFVMGTAAVVLTLAALLWVALSRLKVSVARTVRPVRVHAGSPARVDLRIANVGKRRTPVLRVRDPVDRTRGADISVGPLHAGEQARASYAVPTERRGVIGIGPMRIDITDPFGLATVKVSASAAASLTVFPRIDQISPLAQTAGRDPHGGIQDAQALGRVGDDFYALRQYSVGDDLRRVHWPTTARRGELMVRQDELPWQGRVTVLVDCRSSHQNEETFERSVSAAASIIAASSRRRDLIRLITTAGGDSGFATGHTHIDSLFEHLAVVELTNRGTLHTALSGIYGADSGGAVAAVMGRPRQSEVDTVTRLAGRSASVAVVRFGIDDTGEAGSASSAAPGQRVTLVAVGEGQTFRECWERAMGSPATQNVEASV